MSERVNSLVDFDAECFYRRLMSVVDDYGRFDASPRGLRGMLYPMLLERVSEGDVARWLDDCARVGLVRVYTVCKRNYVQIEQFGQRLRKLVSRYPGPGEEEKRVGGSSAIEEKGREGNRTEGVLGLDGVENHVEDSEMTEAVAIYELYPRKCGKPSALKAILRALRETPASVLRDKTAAFAAIWKGRELTYCPYPASWFNDEGYKEAVESRRDSGSSGRGTGRPDRNKGTVNEGAANLYK